MSVKEERLEMLADIFELMKDEEDLPLPNKYRAAKVAMEYYTKEGYEDDLIEKGRRWRPSEDYIVHHLDEIRAALRRRNKYLEFLYSGDGFKGKWDFLSKKELKQKLTRENGELNTREENYNTRVQDSRVKVPLANPVPLIK